MLELHVVGRFFSLASGVRVQGAICAKSQPQVLQATGFHRPQFDSSPHEPQAKPSEAFLLAAFPAAVPRGAGESWEVASWKQTRGRKESFALPWGCLGETASLKPTRPPV